MDALQGNRRVQEKRGDGMSILIRGMEMPKNCLECPCCTLGYCRVDVKTTEYAKYVFPDGQDDRHSDCPLVEIPTPHGNLKDESDIISLIEVMFCKDKDGMEHAIQCVKDAPTVIEAEGSET